MYGSRLIRSAMTPFPHAVDVEAPLGDARQMMARHRIRHLPVKDGDELVGLITDRDIKLVLGPNWSGGMDGEGPRVRHACIFEIYRADMNTPVHVVATEMARRRIGSVLVTKAGRLAGIFTATDACQYLADVLAEHDPAPRPPGDEAA